MASDNKTLRSVIEEKVRKKAAKNKRDFPDAHMLYYNIFFDIFSSLLFDYNQNYKNMKKIDYIEKRGKLKEYYEIVCGNDEKVRRNYYKMLDERRKKREEEELLKMKRELEKKAREEYEEKVRNGTNTPLDDHIYKGLDAELEMIYQWNRKSMGLDK
ncbi:hypothetical protein [Brevibacillus sp. SYSU BS000544]|uniref:hypothetical protein n=1 Tax=Brevibacillus sp. SYSU BS000544 TaxID=3416443 RepID=UPI003CE5A4E7